ncbi:hypothetical protein [Streptomyces syringium]|uniref:hypothetical protein n=1 Tax=Streptomyces syringium TaxID=76729 RepID=UPI0033F4AF08
MSDQPDLKAHAQDLALITKGLTDALSELGELSPMGGAAAGRGFEDIALTGLELGHAGLAARFKEFCERWEWGVRTLVHDGNEFARRVGLSAGTYYEQDKYAAGTMKVAGAAFGANPNLTDEQVENMSWDEIRANGNFADVDYSGKSFEKSWDHAKETWDGVAKDMEATRNERLRMLLGLEQSGQSEQPGPRSADQRSGDR